MRTSKLSALVSAAAVLLPLGEARAQSKPFDAPLGEPKPIPVNFWINVCGRGVSFPDETKTPGLAFTLDGDRGDARYDFAATTGKSIEPAQGTVPAALVKAVSDAYTAAKPVLDRARAQQLGQNNIYLPLPGGLRLDSVMVWPSNVSNKETNTIWGEVDTDQAALDATPAADKAKLAALSTALWSVAESLLQAHREDRSKKVTGKVSIEKDGEVLLGEERVTGPLAGLLRRLDGQEVTVRGIVSGKTLDVVSVEGTANGKKVEVTGTTGDSFVVAAPRDRKSPLFATSATLPSGEDVKFGEETIAPRAPAPSQTSGLTGALSKP